MAEPPLQRLGAIGYIATIGGDDQDGIDWDGMRRTSGYDSTLPQLPLRT